jgi:hypothetical protein
VIRNCKEVEYHQGVVGIVYIQVHQPLGVGTIVLISRMCDVQEAGPSQIAVYTYGSEFLLPLGYINPAESAEISADILRTI